MKEKVARVYPPYYRWVMLAIFASINFFVNFCQFQPSFFAQDIMAEFNVTTQGFTMMTSFPMMVGMFLAIPAGGLTDRFGLRNTLIVALAITAAGGIARAFCTTYPPLLVMSLLLGVAATFCSANIAKVGMLWFPTKQVGLAIGIITAMGSGGLALAQAVTGILFDDFSTAFFWGGILMAIVFVCWTIFARDKAMVPDIAEAEVEEKKGVRDVLTSKNLWLASFGAACYNGFNVAIGSLLITALVVTWGTNSVTAGVIASLFTIGIVIGAILIPTWVAHVSKAKLICTLLPFISMGILFAAWNINIDAVRCVMFPIAGFFFGAICPIFMSFPSILPEVNNQNSGAAGGMITSIGLVGSVCVPTLIVTPIAGDDYNLMMIIAIVIVLLSAIAFILLPSVYQGGKAAK